jgi:uncharacterized protein (TIGR04255 family)
VNRPPDLPDFRKPPLNEVVIGVQFATPRGYSQIYAGGVWNLFRENFPTVEEQPPLPPAFEVFGRPQPVQFSLGISTGAVHDRFWFLAPRKEELIQFQADRLLHNWRKVGDQTNEYPRFEKMIVSFEGEIKKLEEFFQSLVNQPLAINQCEISYINHIPYEEQGTCPASRWLRFISFEENPPEDFSFSFRRVLFHDGKQIGRIHFEATTAFLHLSQRLIRYTITARGTPSRPDISAAIDFLQMGRGVVVKSFAETTTEFAHKAWERAQ